ncbi:MmgE/PrpD family protein [Enterococcus sp. OL5]|uniref:MmgE/PrpD family protein n=1 Tax=Enterococcus sp. OL5 TaxID=2590214 RepID=UPI00112E2D31|nr:MmgE/PrpD family protein [Enterococcus sp. OL5]TPR55121.1 MmgE/PrpD family protein [Enterococcus sp. OL5]
MDSQRLVQKFLTSQVSEKSLQIAKAALFDYLTVSLAAQSLETEQLKTAYKEQLEGTSLLIGEKGLATKAFSALHNGFRAHLLDLDDTHSSVRGHPSAVLFSALLTELPYHSGKAFLASYVIGLEIMARLGMAVNPDHYLQGWHNTSTLGGLAAAGALAYLKQMTVDQTLHSMSIAASQAAGLQMQFGTPIKPLHAGLAAKQAVEAVAMAQAGLAAEKDFLFADRGFRAVYAPKLNVAPLLEDWGKSWQVNQPGLWVKSYPFCSAAMSGADAAEYLHQKEGLREDEIAGVEVLFFKGRDQALKNRQPKTGEEGRFSIEYIVWLGLTGQEYSLDAFSSKALSSALRRQLLKVQRTYQEGSSDEPFVTVTVNLTDGRKLSQQVTYPKGSPRNPLTEKERRKKFTTYVRGPWAKPLEEKIKRMEQEEGDSLFSFLQTINGGKTDGRTCD